MYTANNKTGRKYCYMEAILKTDNIFKEADKVAIVMQERGEKTEEKAEKKSEEEKLLVRLCKNDEGEFLWSRYLLEVVIEEENMAMIKNMLNQPDTLIITDDVDVAKYLKADFGIEKNIYLLSDFAKSVLKGFVDEDVPIETLFDVASVFSEYEDLRTFDSYEWLECFKRVINYLLHFHRLCEGIVPQEGSSVFAENLMNFILDRPGLSIAGVHMYTDADGKKFFMATKEPFESLYLETTDESAYDDLYQFMEETDVICGYGLSDEILFFINKTCMEKGRIPSYSIIDIKDLMHELYEISEDAETELNYLYALNRLLIKPSFDYLYSKSGLELPLLYVKAARKICDDYTCRQK